MSDKYKFKVGDIVVSRTDSCTDIVPGTHYKVVDVDGDGFDILDDDGDRRTREYSEYELVDGRHFVFKAPVFEAETYDDALKAANEFATGQTGDRFFVVRLHDIEAYELMTSVQRVTL